MNAVVIWKPVEKALSVVKNQKTFQTFLNKLSHSLGSTVTKDNLVPVVRKEIEKGGARAVAVKSAILGAASGVVGAEAYDTVKGSIFESAVNEKELQLLENIVGESIGTVADAIAETLDDTPGFVRGIENVLVDEAVRTVEESLMYASTLVGFAGSVDAARRLLLAIRNADLKDLDVYERFRAF